MKRALGIYIGILALLLIAATGWRMHPAEPESNELYERCKDVPGVRVGFVKDYPLNDSVSCDVTTVEALTDEGWEWMVEEFDLMPLIRVQEVMDSMASVNNKTMIDKDNTVLARISPRFHPEQYGPEVAETLGDTCDAVFMSLYYRWVADFHCVKARQYSYAIKYYTARLGNQMANPTSNTAAEAIQ